VKSQSFSPPPGKVVNSPSSLIRDDLLGIAAAYPGLVRLVAPDTLFRAVPKDQEKVALVIGHGGGHTPSMGGFVGPGLLDADVYGPLFTCASGARISDAILQADLGAGVALLVSNHTGDVLNARLAVRLARSQGVVVESVLLGDDVATAPREKLEERRGLGGLLFALKVGGAAAEAGYPLPKVIRLMQTTNERTATLAVALHPPRHPISGLPLFELPDGEIEIGTGVHGEVGVYRGPHLPANEIIDLLLDRLAPDLDDFEREGMLLFVNGSGGTSQMELHTAYQRAFQVMKAQGIEVRAGIVGSFFTTLEMAGFSLSLCALNDELWQLWEKPASGAHFHWPYK
jgi:dihydroxyacetone kinase-like protein